MPRVRMPILSFSLRRVRTPWCGVAPHARETGWPARDGRVNNGERSEVLTVGDARVLQPLLRQEGVHVAVDDAEPGLGVHPVVDRQVARRLDGTGELDRL